MIYDHSFLILQCVLDPKQDTVAVTSTGPDAAACENTVWANPPPTEGSASELL